MYKSTNKLLTAHKDFKDSFQTTKRNLWFMNLTAKLLTLSSSLFTLYSLSILVSYQCNLICVMRFFCEENGLSNDTCK